MQCRANVLTWYRLPLNLITVSLLLASAATSASLHTAATFLACSTLCAAGCLLTSLVDTADQSP